jgi:tetratricopeptide repeat protein
LLCASSTRRFEDTVLCRKSRVSQLQLVPRRPKRRRVAAVAPLDTGKPLSPEAAHFAAEQDAAAKQQADEIGAAIRNKDPELLLELFGNGGLAWETSSALGCKAAEGLIKLGRNDDGIQMLETIEAGFPRAVRPRQLRALALARRNRTADLRLAQRVLGALYEAGERDPETLGIYGRTWMDRYSQSDDRADLEQSRDLYAEAFEGASDDYYTGINAASKSVLLGTADDLVKAAAYAARVQKIVGMEPHPGDYWMTATVGEVFLLIVLCHFQLLDRAVQAS